MLWPKRCFHVQYKKNVHVNLRELAVVLAGVSSLFQTLMKRTCTSAFRILVCCIRWVCFQTWQVLSGILWPYTYKRINEPAGYHLTQNYIFEVFGLSRPRACMHCGSDSCIKKTLLMRIFWNRPLDQLFRVQVPIAHLPRRLCHRKKESPSFQNEYLVRISSKWRSERTSIKPVVIHLQIEHTSVYSGS